MAHVIAIHQAAMGFTENGIKRRSPGEPFYRTPSVEPSGDLSSSNRKRNSRISFAAVNEKYKYAIQNGICWSLQKR